MTCQSCKCKIPEKRVGAVLRNTGKYPTYCVNCQANHNQKVVPFDSAMAICGESDDSTRVVESGWNETAHRTRTNHRVERLLKIYNIPA